MNLAKWMGVSLSLVFGWSFLVYGTLSCSNTPTQAQSCKSKSDCQSGWSCINRLCLKPCVDDKDCKSLELTCQESYCGGIVKPDGGVTDEPAGECIASATRECYTGPSATKGVGECKAGKQTCSAEGKWGKCEGEVLPQAEICNGKDDDCDSNIDNNCGTSCTVGQTRECYTGVEGTKGVGPCKAGKETCQKDGSWGQCEGQVLPVPENCNTTIDDNCNGKVNEDCECTPGQTEDCKADNGCAGIRTCQKKQGTNGTEWGVCLATKPYDEKCDELDNDCDGKVDNQKGTDKPLTRPCNNEPCKDQGIETCEKGQWKNCTGRKSELEKCDGIDNDCDGNIDNIENKLDPLVKGCDSGKPGLCKNGQQFCKDGKFGECVAPEPTKEQCNDFDDDCDGKVDEEEDKPCPDGQECFRDTLGVKKCVPK